jgi:glucose/arabinose dehydrogenase
MTDGSCADLTPADCVTQGGTPQGPGTTCTSAACVADEACCMTDGSCADLAPADCVTQGGTPQGAGTTCTSAACVADEACCMTDGSCAELAPADCVTQGGTPQGPGTRCVSSTCIPNEACCLRDGSCADLAAADCTAAGGTPQGVGSACSSATCAPYEACCTGTGACSDAQPADCLAAGSTPLGPCTKCTSSICPSPCPSGAPVSGRPPLRRVLVGAFNQPIFMTSPPGDYDRIFVLERQGRIQILHRSGARTQFLDFSALVPSLASEKGALGLAFHPDYACNGKFYVHYSGAATAGCGPDNCATLVEYTVSANPDVANPASARIILQQADFAGNHNGGWIAFGPDGYLYQAFGDGGGGGDPNENGQNPGIWLGKILRIDVDGRDPGLQYAVPPTNPFVGVAGTLPEIWALGVRNPWRDSFDRGTGDFYIADVGQGSWEEIDVSPASAGGGRGLNFGWDDMEGLVCYEPAAGCLTAGRTLPDYVYSHGDGCSITGGYVYRGCRMPGWNGVYFFADYCNEWMDAFEYVGGVVTNYQRVFPGGTLNSPVSFGEDAAGELYIIEQGGPIYRLEP